MSKEIHIIGTDLTSGNVSVVAVRKGFKSRWVTLTSRQDSWLDA